MENIPVIKLELERMKHSVMSMLDPQVVSDQMSKAIDEAMLGIDFCKIAEHEIKKGLHEALQNEIRRFFSYGPGNQRVKDILLEALQEAE